MWPIIYLSAFQTFRKSFYCALEHVQRFCVFYRHLIRKHCLYNSKLYMSVNKLSFINHVVQGQVLRNFGLPYLSETSKVNWPLAHMVQLVEASSHTPKGVRFNSQSGHITGLRVWSRSQHVWEATNWCFSLPSSLSEINKCIFKKNFRKVMWKSVQLCLSIYFYNLCFMYS